MNLLGNNGTKLCAPQRSVKEILLNQEIKKLKYIFRHSSEALQQVVVLLKKTMNKKCLSGEPNSQINIHNNFLNDLNSIETAFFSLMENMESDRQLFTSSVMFRDSQKILDSIFFKKMMKNHEDFKQKLNSIILQLQKDIQLLQNNGFNVYDFNVKPNNVLNSLKRVTLEKYLISLGEIQVIYSKIMNAMSNRVTPEKKAIKISFKNDIQRYRQVYRSVIQINLKEKLINSMLIEQIYKIKMKIQNEKQKFKNIEESIKLNNKSANLIETEIKIYNEEQVSKTEIYNLSKHLKQKVDSLIIITPQLGKQINKRSKSCYSVIITRSSRQICHKMKQHSIIQNQSSKVLPGDFLQESMQN